MRKHMYKMLVKATDPELREKIIDEIQASSRIEYVYRSGVFKEIRKVQIGQPVTLIINGRKQLSTLMHKTKAYALFSYTGEQDALFSLNDGTLLIVDKLSEDKSPSKRIRFEYNIRVHGDLNKLKFNDGKVMPCQ